MPAAAPALVGIDSLATLTGGLITLWGGALPATAPPLAFVMAPGLVQAIPVAPGVLPPYIGSIEVARPVTLDVDVIVGPAEITGIAASVVVTPPFAGPTPVTTGFVAIAPTASGSLISLAVGNGQQVPGALYSVVLAITCGSATMEAIIPLICPA